MAKNLVQDERDREREALRRGERARAAADERAHLRRIAGDDRSLGEIERELLAAQLAMPQIAVVDDEMLLDLVTGNGLS